MISLIKYKIKALFAPISFSANILNSHIDKHAVVRQKCRIYGSTIDRYTYITRCCLIQNTQIGAFCSISENCYIGMPSHPIQYFSTSPVFFKGKNYFKKNFSEIEHCNSKTVHIGNDVWIGVGVKIKDGINIGDGAIIGAGAVVTKDVPAYEIWAGNPAHFIKKRFDSKKENQIKNSGWWKLDDCDLENYNI